MKKMTKPNINKHNWGKLTLELIVVFLGVTAGFLLNNWRSNANDRSLEKNYKISFLSEVNSNITTLKNSISQDSVWIARATPILKLIEGNSLSVDSAQVVIVLISNFNRVILTSNTYENITNSGSFNLIRDFELRESLVSYYSDMIGIETLNDYLFSFYNSFIMPFIMKEISLVNNQFNNPNNLQTASFSNIFSLQYYSVYQRHAAYQAFLERSNDLKEKLTNSLS